jgi:signal transduction histidine kinase
MGTLVAGVAHEINNPLAGAMSGQGLAIEIVREIRERMRGDAPISRAGEARALDHLLEALEDAQECGLRIATIVKELSIFGRPDSRRQRVRPIDIVEGARRWLPAAVARSVAITVEDGRAPEVEVAQGQLEQVVLNLLTNAARATVEGRPNPIVVRTGRGSPGMARIEVADRGAGIAPEILDRIFEPFFTTRPAGTARGSGLGLAISQAIVAAHQGTLTVESVPGEGSTFRVELPVATPAG